jgi:hypothetical protein
MRQTKDYGSNLGFLSEIVSERFGGLVGRWVGGLMGRWVGNQNAKKEICRRVGGLVGSCAGRLVSGMPKRNWYWAHRDFFPARTNCCFLRWNGKELSDFDNINNECSIFNMKTL